MNGDLLVDNNNIATTGFTTPFVSVGTGISTDLATDTLTDNIANWRINDLVGIYLNPDINQVTSPNIVFQILSNNSTSIKVGINAIILQILPQSVVLIKANITWITFQL